MRKALRQLAGTLSDLRHSYDFDCDSIAPAPARVTERRRVHSGSAFMAEEYRGLKRRASDITDEFAA